MGLRGIGAKTLAKRESLVGRAEGLVTFSERIHPWSDPTLTRAERVIVFCEDLTITSGEEAFKKLRLREWQKAFIRAVYRETEDGERPVRTAILSMGRKNGKTQLAAALALCHLSGPEAESRGEIYSCANDRFQAGKIFNEMVALIQNHPWLSEQTNVVRFRKDIEDLSNGSIYSALTAEHKTKMGLNPSFIVYDELGQTSSRALYDAMDSALGARKNPLLLVISTQAADDFAPMSQLIDYGLKVNAGEIKDPSFHLTFYTAPEDADPWTLKTWKAANPALNDFRSLPDVRRLAKQAQRMPSQENAFRNLILNQRVAAETRFVEMRVWKQCGEQPLIPQGAPVYAGLDLGGTRDLTALVLVFIDANGVAHVVPHCWIPGNLRDRSDEERMPYESWARQKLITPAGVTTDPEAVARRIAEINGQNKILGLAFDRWRILDLKRELDKIGCLVPLVEHGQGYKDMTPAVEIVDRLIAQKRIRHGNHPVLQMCAVNAVITKDPAGGKKFDKAKSVGRIDALVALAMALNIALTKQQKPIDIDSLIG
jgi:phage terminase large subunit-like protein